MPRYIAIARRHDVLSRAPQQVRCCYFWPSWGAQTLEDLFARGTHRELLGITSRHPDLAAERHHRVTRHGTVHDLVLANIVREPLVVARLADLLLDLLALDHRGGCRGPSWLPLRR